MCADTACVDVFLQCIDNAFEHLSIVQEATLGFHTQGWNCQALYVTANLNQRESPYE